MKKNEVFTAACVDYTYNGLGVVKSDTFCVFVKDMIKGERGKIVLTADRKEYGYGRLLELLEASDERVEATCPISRQCGGCQLQHMSHKHQCEFKREHVRNTLKNIGGLTAEVSPILFSETPFGYRNKTILPVGKKDGKTVVGFYRTNSHEIIPMDYCCLQTDYSNHLIDKLRQLISEYDLADSVRNIMIRDFESTEQTMVVLVTNKPEVDKLDYLVRDLIKAEGRIRSVIQNINPDDTNVVLGQKEKLLYGSWYIQDILDGLRFEVSSKSFYQVNSRQTKLLYSKAIELADIKQGDTVVDLYCGVGTIGLLASRKAEKVIGVEIVPRAVEDARKNAVLNSISNIEFICGDASDCIRRIGETAEVVFIDPPRKGCSEKVLEDLIKMQCNKIVYVSCNPATLARDLKYLSSHGYEVKAVQPVDMFPQSYHCETVVLLSKGDIDKGNSERSVAVKAGDGRRINGYSKENNAPETMNVKVDFSLEDLDLSELKGKATYEQIKDFVREQTGFRVSSLYISQVKKKCGLEVGESYNKPKSEDARQPQVIPEKEEAIMKAFRHFGVI